MEVSKEIIKSNFQIDNMDNSENENWNIKSQSCEIIEGTSRANHMLPALVFETPWWSP